jgi:hypothetical protein
VYDLGGSEAYPIHLKVVITSQSLLLRHTVQYGIGEIKRGYQLHGMERQDKQRLVNKFDAFLLKFDG